MSENEASPYAPRTIYEVYVAWWTLKLAELWNEKAIREHINQQRALLGLGPLPDSEAAREKP